MAFALKAWDVLGLKIDLGAPALVFVIECLGENLLDRLSLATFDRASDWRLVFQVWTNTQSGIDSCVQIADRYRFFNVS